ncbi:MAG: PHP-associated domain-containing protein [Halobacteriaceae archaeon]
MNEKSRFDLHTKVLNTEIIERAKARGLDGLVYAPHFTRLSSIKREIEQYDVEDFCIIPGREVFTGNWRNRKHVLALGLEDPIPDFITLAGAMDEFQRQGAVVLVPHPDYFTVGLNEDDIQEYQSQIVGIETYNPKYWNRHQKRAQRLATTYNLPEFGSSYAHLSKTVGEVWTTFDTRISTEDELLDALTDTTTRTVSHRSGPHHELRCFLEFGHLLWENTWQKVDRVMLSGLEPTHPRHVAYEDRFESVAVDQPLF